MKFARYSSYKDSGFNWIGEIPTNWGIKRVGHHIDFITGFAFKSEHFSFDSGIKLVRGDNVTEGMLRWGDKTRYWPVISNDIKQYLLCEKDILIGMDGSKVGKNHTLIQKDDLPLLLVQRVARLRTDEQLNYKYLYHLISSNLFKVWVALVKTDPAIPHISPADIKGFPLPFPSIDEQQKIANFLDHETAKIDTLIAKQEKLIELLKEKRQAVISHAVTKGLNPDVPMKDSGVEWLGEVPEHWIVSSIKYLSSFVGTGGTPKNQSSFVDDNDAIKWFAPGDFSDKIELTQSSKHISYEAVASGDAKLYKESSVLVIGIGATLGKVALCKDEFSCNQQINMITPNKKTIAEFITFSLSAQHEQMKQLSNASTIGIMNQEKTKSIQIAQPPLAEQIEIVKYLNIALERFKLLESKATKQVDLLKERKTALISAAVTGKIDVRDWEPK